MIVFMFKNDVITFKEQQIFINNLSFKRYMKDLHDKGMILIRRVNGDCNQYKLTDKGKYFAMILNELAE